MSANGKQTSHEPTQAEKNCAKFLAWFVVLSMRGVI